MKHLLFALTVLLFSFQYVHAQDIPEGAIMLDENTVIKDEAGNEVEMFKLMELMNSGEWSMDPVNDSDGKLLYLQLRKATDEEKMMMEQMPMMENSSSLIGESAPEFKMKDLDGKTISSKKAKGKVIVLNFWFTSCKPCISEIPELNEVYEKYKDNKNIIFTSITFDKKDRVDTFLNKHSIDYPVVSGAKDICDTFGITSYPTNIVIDKNGNYFDHISGGFPQIGSQISNSIQDALDGVKPNTSGMPAEKAIIDPSSVFKLENGNLVPFEKAIELLNSQSYDVIDKKDENNKDYYLLKKKG